MISFLIIKSQFVIESRSASIKWEGTPSLSFDTDNCMLRHHAGPCMHQLKNTRSLGGPRPSWPQLLAEPTWLWDSHFPEPQNLRGSESSLRLSGNFADCLTTFQTVRKFSRLSGNFPDCSETFQIVCKILPECPESFWQFGASLDLKVISKIFCSLHT